MGNYMSTKLGGMDESIGHISNEASSSFHSAAADRTPSRRTFKVEDAQFLDPRSPTVDIERTPIAIVDTNSLLPVDPRSPTAGITRTPFTVTTAPENIIPEIFIETVETEKELENLAQVLNFTDLDCLSLSNIEEPQEEEGGEEPQQEEKETLNLESFGLVLATSTPTPSPIKTSSNRINLQPNRSSKKDENSFNTSCSGKSINLAHSPSSSRPRVPLGNVNRPSLVASPRLALQNRQKQSLRNELVVQQGRLKTD